MTAVETGLSVLTTIFLSSWVNQPFSLITGALWIFGMWGIFQKCGIKGWYALIPCLREAKTGEAAGMEKEGRVVAFLAGLNIPLSIIDLFEPESDTTGNIFLLLGVIRIFLGLIQVIYLIRIYIALTEVFDRKKKWVILWVVADWIPALMWGWMKKYQPLWKAEEMKNTAADFFSGSKAAPRSRVKRKP